MKGNSLSSFTILYLVRIFGSSFFHLLSIIRELYPRIIHPSNVQPTMTTIDHKEIQNWIRILRIHFKWFRVHLSFQEHRQQYISNTWTLCIHYDYILIWSFKETHTHTHTRICTYGLFFHICHRKMLEYKGKFINFVLKIY